MSSTVGSMKNVKIFVLYLMENVGKPLDFVTLNDIVMQTDYIMYLDFAEAFHKMLDDELIRAAILKDLAKLCAGKRTAVQIGCDE